MARVGTGTGGLGTALVAANAAGALLSMAACTAGLVRPGIGLPAGEPVTEGVRLYAEANGARALPLGAVLLHQLARGGRALPVVLLLAGAVQLGDAAIGVRTRNARMAAGAGALALLHLETARRAARGAR